LVTPPALGSPARLFLRGIFQVGHRGFAQAYENATGASNTSPHSIVPA
jgi:hypothetical protein